MKVNDMTEGVILPTKEEMKEFWKHRHELDDWAQSLTEEQKDHLCNSGYYNNTIKGYLVLAARDADFTDDQIKALLSGCHYALDMHDKAAAERAYNNF